MKFYDSVLTLQSKIKSDPYNPVHHIALAKAYLEQGDEERARKVVAIKRRLPTKDSFVHFEWGMLCEELGMASQARESYEQAISLEPANPEYHFRITRLFYEKGAWERAIRHLQKTVALSSQNDKARQMLASIYTEMGLHGSADVVEKKKPKVESQLQTIPFQLTQEDVDLILDLFRGRELGYAEYHLVETGNKGYVYFNKVLGMREISDHLRGERTIGVYLLRGDRTLRCCGVEIKIPWRKLVSSFKDKGALAILEDKVHAYAMEIKAKAKELGFPAYCEDSGDRGRRVWFFFEDFIPYEMAERFLSDLLGRIYPIGMGLSVEFMLGFKPSGIGKADEPVMLPLGVNRASGKRSFFIDEEGRPYDDQILLFKKIRRISRNDIQRLFKGFERENRGIGVFSSNLFAKIQKQCPIIEAIVLKAKSGRILRVEEKLILYFTIGFLPDAIQLLHEIMEPCPDYRPKKIERMVSRLGKNPISCPKIRHLVPELTSYLSCKCSFHLEKGLYPTPLLHIDPALVRPHPQEIAYSSLEEIELRYAMVVRKIEQLTQERIKLEAVLKELGSCKVFT